MKAKNVISQTVQKWQSALVELTFPKTCFFCHAPKTFLCPDCETLCEISPAHVAHRGKFIDDCYAAASYDNRFVKRLVSAFKYEPLSRELAGPLARLIGNHVALLDQKPDFSEYTIVPVPLSKQRLRWRGYNQAGELAKNLGAIFKIPNAPDYLARSKNTACQVGLTSKQRQQNIAGAFSCPNPKKVLSKMILLVDDVITTGATIEECAKTLIKSGAGKVVAIAVAQARIGDA